MSTPSLWWDGGTTSYGNGENKRRNRIDRQCAYVERVGGSRRVDGLDVRKNLADLRALWHPEDDRRCTDTFLLLSFKQTTLDVRESGSRS